MNGSEMATILARLDGLSGRVNLLGEHQREDCAAMRKDISGVQVAIASLKVKAGAWGALAGAIPVIILALFFLLRAG